MKGLVLAAPASGAGKTVITLALLRAYRARGIAVRAAKSGPDYIDPAFHAAACGWPSVNLDGWAMAPALIRSLAAGQGDPASGMPGGSILLIEGAMGALDAAADGRGSVAALADMLGLPLVLVLDAAGQGQSAALAAAGLRAMRPGLALAGVIFNRIASPRHAALARAGLAELGVPVFGAVSRDPALALPERHLGLVQAAETAGLQAWLDRAGEILARSVDLDALLGAAADLAAPTGSGWAKAVAQTATLLPPPGQRIALAWDTAFAFAYPHLLAGWQSAGAEILPFSPLADEAPDSNADAVFLPGGYPELQAGRLAAADGFRRGMHAAARRGARIDGECGGYMVLGEGLIDAKGGRHSMLGLLPLETSFAERRLSLGYRRLDPLPGAAWPGALAAHEFHYATILREGAAARLFSARDAAGMPLAPMGLRQGGVSGSFAHLIAPWPDA
ncbi:MAG: cobyrinate a,c-diamide synthase [Pseudomonadota bacterium]